jgi:uncharacterized protein (TIGR02145 family)
MKSIKILILCLPILFFTTCAKEDVDPNEFVNDQNLAVLSPGAVVIPENILTEIINFSENEIILKNWVDDSIFKIGNIIIGGISEKTPFGVLKKVTAIDYSDDVIKITVIDASLQEAFDELHLITKGRISGSEIDFRAVCSSYEADLELINFSTEACVTFDLIFNFVADEYLEVGFDNFELSLNDFSFSSTVETTEFSSKKTLFQVNGTPIFILVSGIIPIIISPQFTIKGVVDNTSISGGVTFPSFSGSVNFGRKALRFDSSGNILTSPNNTGISFNSSFEDIKYFGEMNASLGLDFSYGYSFYGYEGTSASVTVATRANINAGVATNFNCPNLFETYVNSNLTVRPLIECNILTWNFTRPMFGNSFISSFLKWDIYNNTWCLGDGDGADNCEMEINLSPLECVESDGDDDDGIYKVSYSGLINAGERDQNYEYELFVGNVSYGLYKYSTNYNLIIPEGIHVVKIEDVTDKNCVNYIFIEAYCNGGVLETTSDTGEENTTCNNQITDSRDGQKYCYVTVCKQPGDCRKWLRRNLRFNTGSSPFVNNDPSRWRLGRLYSWSEVVSGNLCPSGYRVATADDYHHLFEAIEQKHNLSNTLTGYARYLKASYAWYGSGNGDGGVFYSRFFELFPNGYLSIWDNKFQEVGLSNNLWTSTEYPESEHSAFSINAEYNTDDVLFVPVVKNAFRLGVRCVCESGCN